MPKYEYYWVDIYKEGNSQELNALGAQGWRVVQAVGRENKWLLLERQVPDTQEVDD